MSQFNKKKINKFWHSPLVLIVLFFIVILFFNNIINLIEKERVTVKKKNLVSSEVEVLKNREKSLSYEIEKLKTEEGIEETIREKYPVGKKGERVVTIIDKEISKISSNEQFSKKFFIIDWFKNIFK